MIRHTIDYGIDLGTTNSEIACLDGTHIEVFRNAEGFEYTPSAVWIDKQGKISVGKEAKDRCESDPENAFMEFKRDMGTHTEYTFVRSGTKMKPEELSAEVLKSLKSDVQRRNGEVITSAIITVPADFDSPQWEATKRAADIAGIKSCILLPEPVAAAQAYGFEREEDRTFWLVYDFGGGTFDAAIIQVREGLIQVVGHAGDNQLGGKNIDWAIVEQLFIPSLLKERRLTDFGRHNPKWRGAIAKLKIQAEEAKIKLSTRDSTEIAITDPHFLCKDDCGDLVEFSFVLTRDDLQRLAAPFIRRTINLCKEALSGRRLSPANISKTILVGGPTLMPFLRDQLKDAKDGLGIPLESNVDPLTVVARGAAVFAGTQRLPENPDRLKNLGAGQYSIKLDYTPVGPDIDPPVAGTVSPGEGVEQDFTGFSVEFINAEAHPPWRSGRIQLGPKGNFLTALSAEKGKANQFQIELHDPSGTLLEVTPKTFQITVKGIGAVQITLPHSVGVALANNEVVWFFEKDSVIPARKCRGLHTAIPLQRGQTGQLLRVPVVEGSKNRADRNRIVGTLLIPGDNIAHDVPVGSDIEVTIEINESRLISSTAFIPILNQEFENVMPLESVNPEQEQLAEALARAKERLHAVREKARKTNDRSADGALQRIESEGMVPELERLVSAAAADHDAGRQALNLLNSFESALDDAEDALEWPALVAETQNNLTETRKMVHSSNHATETDKQNFDALEREIHDAIVHCVPDLLRRRKEALDALVADVALKDPGPWVYYFEELKSHRNEMRDPAQADRLIAQGDRAVASNDFNGLKVAVIGLLQLSSERLRTEFNDLKNRRRQMTDPTKAAELIAEGENAIAQNDMGALGMVIQQLRQLRSGVIE